MKRVNGSRGWIAAAFTILLTVGLIAVQTKAAIEPSGEAPTTLPAPVLSDSGGGVACPSDVLMWTSVTGATSYQLWSAQVVRGFVPIYNEIYSGTAQSLRVTLSRGTENAYKAAACDAQGCSGFSNVVTVTEGTCP